MNEGRRSVASAIPAGPQKATRSVMVWVAAAVVTPALCVALAACGQRGPLTLPPPPATSAATAQVPVPTTPPASSPPSTP